MKGRRSRNDNDDNVMF